MNEINVPLTVAVDSDVGLTVSDGGPVAVGVDTTITAAIMPHYTGETTVTPGDTAQVLATAGQVLDSDIVVERVPGNYGRIAWDGSVLTVY